MTFTNVDEGYGWRTFSDTMSIAPDLSATSRFSEGKRFAYLRDFAWLFGFTWIYYVSFLHPPSFGCLRHRCPTCCRDSTKSWHVRHRRPVMPCQVEHADKPERLDACLSGHRCNTKNLGAVLREFKGSFVIFCDPKVILVIQVWSFVDSSQMLGDLWLNSSRNFQWIWTS